MAPLCSTASAITAQVTPEGVPLMLVPLTGADQWQSAPISHRAFSFPPQVMQVQAVHPLGFAVSFTCVKPASLTGEELCLHWTGFSWQH